MAKLTTKEQLFVFTLGRLRRYPSLKMLHDEFVITTGTRSTILITRIVSRVEIEFLSPFSRENRKIHDLREHSAINCCSSFYSESPF